MDEPFPSIDPWNDEFTQNAIKRNVKWLLTQPGFEATDRQDLEHELLAHVSRCFKKYRPSEGHPYPFITAVIYRKAINLARNQQAAKQPPSRVVSLQTKVALGDEGTTEFSQLIAEQDSDRRLHRERRLSVEELSSLKQDMESVIATLPPSHRELLELFQSHSLRQIAAMLGVHRNTLSKWLMEIRQRFAEVGLDSYFEK